MVLGYNYSKQKWRWQQTNAPHPPAVLMATADRQHCPMRHVQGYSGNHWTPASGNYLLCIAPAAARATGKQTTINKHTCKAGHFDGHGDAAVRNRAHRPMEEVQSFTRSNWTPPPGKYYAG
jgi:hypothetical protein